MQDNGNLNQPESIQNLFKSLIDNYGKDFYERCEETLHNVIFRITQNENIDFDLEVQNEITVLNDLYKFFRNKDLHSHFTV